MKDAKGHGSNPRGTAPAYAGRDAMGRTYTQAIRDHDRFPKQNPTMPNAEDYRTDRAAANALAAGNPKAQRVPVHDGAQGRFKVQSLDTKLTGRPWRTEKGYGRRAVAERVAQHMRTDGGYTRVRQK